MKVIAQVKKAYEVVESIVNGDGETLIVKAGSKHFAICPDGDIFNIYQCFGQSQEWKFLPGFKQVKSFKGVSNFISARI